VPGVQRLAQPAGSKLAGAVVAANTNSHDIFTRS
jgi:hypothetical protein